MSSSQFHARAGTLIEILEERPGAIEWLVRFPDGTDARAIAFPTLGSVMQSGQPVWLNTTAAELSLGTGGTHFVLGPAEPEAVECGAEWGDAARRSSGHLMKLRYTPLQHAVLSVEEEASAHHVCLTDVTELQGLPVIAAELHSAAMAAAIAARACGARRVVWVMTDGAALPLGVCRLAARLRAEGVLAATVTAGQAFGGDLEAVTVASALAAAREVFAADVVVVGQGPGNAGTGTALGFSGMGQAEHLNTAAALGSFTVAALRVSFSDPRPRHQGLSHHSATVLGRMTLVPVQAAVPVLVPEREAVLRQGIEAAGLPTRHDLRRVAADDLLETLAPYHDRLTTMGRTIEEDPEFFLAACAAGRLAVEPPAGLPWSADVMSDE